MMYARFILTLAPLLALSAMGCDDSNGTKGECTDNGHCAEMQVCRDEACVDVECLNSTQCEIGNFCNTEITKYVCEPGCEADDDCSAGESCNVSNHTCEAYGCRTTTLDCPAGQVCNSTTGNCEVFDAGLCTTCDIYATRDTCGSTSVCQAIEYVEGCRNDQDCEQDWLCDPFLTSETICLTANDCPDGSTCQVFQCVANFCHLDYCFAKCQYGAPESCPAGFSCADMQGGQDFCWSDCGYMLDHGYL